MNDNILPTRYDRPLADLTSTPGNRDALTWCGRWLHDEGVSLETGLVLVGDPGTGKTAIACALLHDADRVGVGTGYISAPNLRAGIIRQMDLMEVIRKLANVDDDTEELIEWRTRSGLYWEWAHETQLLLIDDLGREMSAKSTRFVESHIDELLRNRGDKGLATVITTNLTKQQRTQRYGEPLMSYLQGVCDWFEIEGGDWRRGEG